MTRIMQICMVLVVMVSAFFYAPVEVSAEETLIVSPEILEDDTLYTDVMPLSVGNSVTPLSRYFASISAKDSVTYNFSNYLDNGSGLYKVTVNFKTLYNSGVSSTYWRAMTTLIDVSGSRYAHYVSVADASATCSSTDQLVFYVNTSSPTATVHYRGNLIWTSLPASTVSVNCSYSVSVVSAEKVTATDSEQYQNGYDAGYSAGEFAGYSNGYSNGYAEGESDGYDTGFESGVESVDTQSYYDAGYNAGYNKAYSVGYDTGYDDGYQNAMDRVANWGADTSTYPVLKKMFNVAEYVLLCDTFTSVPSTSYSSGVLFNLDFDINPNHTYRFNIKHSGVSGGAYDALYSDFDLNIVIGSSNFDLTNISGSSRFFYMPGYNMDSLVNIEAYVYDAVYYGGVDEEEGFLKYTGQIQPTVYNLYINVYDMGPSGDTQNHIANQTDQLTNGYDSSGGQSVNDNFKASVNDYHTAEDSLFTTAKSGLEDFTFVDFTSITGMVTALSFVTSIMTSIYMAMGGDTGASGIILAVLFSVMLVSMAIGLYRYYVSNGKSGGSNKGGD